MVNRKNQPPRRDNSYVPMPPEIEKLRNARKVIDLTRTYHMRMPDGTIFSATGEELLETAEAFLDLADACKTNDYNAIRDAIERLGFNP